MANEEHVRLLAQGVECWNQWREANPEVRPDLSGVYLGKIVVARTPNAREVLQSADIPQEEFLGKGLNLSKTDLSGCCLEDAVLDEATISDADLRSAELARAALRGAIISNSDLSGANLTGTNLRGADLTGTNLGGADLTGTDLTGANISRAAVDQHTHYDKTTKGCQIGVNGIWSAATDSAALMTLTPPGNSMQGSNPEAVVEMLKRARHLHALSMTLSGFTLLIFVLGLRNIKPTFFDSEVSVERFGLLVMPMSIGLLILATSFFLEALKGTRYLADRKSVMAVGKFPWVLSRYAGGDRSDRYQSVMMRLAVSFHPLAYMLFLDTWQVFNTRDELHLEYLDVIIFATLLVLLIALSALTFYISELFQKPILFDSKTEEEHVDDIKRLAKAIEVQTARIADVFDILKDMPTDCSGKDDTRKTVDDGK